MKEKTNIVNFICFIVLILTAVLIFITQLLKVIGVNVSGVAINVLQTVTLVLTLFVIATAAFKQVKNGRKFWKILYWICIAIFVAGIVLVWFIK